MKINKLAPKIYLTLKFNAYVIPNK